MPIAFKDKYVQMISHGGVKSLDELQHKRIQVTIRFPYKLENGKYTLMDLTMNALRDFGISINNKVYCIDWGDKSKDNLSYSSTRNPARLEHVYSVSGTKTSPTVIFNVELYGESVLRQESYTYEVGVEPTGYKVEVKEVRI